MNDMPIPPIRILPPTIITEGQPAGRPYDDLPTEVYVMIIEDRHVDVEVQVFRTEHAARKAMADYREQLIEWRDRDEWVNHFMIKDGWIASVSYSSEGDCVRIQKVTVH
jgi:hypothetical protein